MVQTLEIPHAEGYPPIKVVLHAAYAALAAELREAKQECEQAQQENATLRATVERLRQENELLRGAMSAQDERERQAAARLGMIHNCDWPESVADEVEGLRETVERLTAPVSDGEHLEYAGQESEVYYRMDVDALIAARAKEGNDGTHE